MSRREFDGDVNELSRPRTGPLRPRPSVPRPRSLKAGLEAKVCVEDYMTGFISKKVGMIDVHTAHVGDL